MKPVTLFPTNSNPTTFAQEEEPLLESLDLNRSALIVLYRKRGKMASKSNGTGTEPVPIAKGEVKGNCMIGDRFIIAWAKMLGKK